MINDTLTVESLRAARVSPEVAICLLDCVDSTNSHAKRLALDGAEAPTLVVANRQTAGRGRMGRSFYSPADTGAYFSILYEPQQRFPVTWPRTG